MQVPANLDDEFTFYIKFAKPLVLSLPQANERVRAASWIQRLRAEKSDPSLRNDYLKLLLFVLQRERLVGPFSNLPEKDAPLDPFPEGCMLTDMAKHLIRLEEKEHGPGDQSPYTTEVSSDLKEYAAIQHIPHFGVHFYLAVSNEPISQWDRADKGYYPKVPATTKGRIHFESPVPVMSAVAPKGPTKSRMVTMITHETLSSSNTVIEKTRRTDTIRSPTKQTPLRAENMKMSEIFPMPTLKSQSRRTPNCQEMEVPPSPADSYDDEEDYP